MSVTIHSESEMKPLWDLNDKYPLFVTCVEWDHVSAPKHNLAACVLVLNKKLAIAFNDYTKAINLQIEQAEEDFNDDLKRELLLKRKNLRDKLKQDFSKMKNVDELLLMVPDELKLYF